MQCDLSQGWILYNVYIIALYKTQQFAGDFMRRGCD